MPKIRVDVLNLHYWQSGEGPDVVLVHGLGGNLAGWHLTMVPELQREYRVTTYDLRGHGRSDAPARGYTTRDMADDLAGLLDALNIPQASIVGHSWGADIALHFALAYPRRISDLVLIEAALLAPCPTSTGARTGRAGRTSPRRSSSSRALRCPPTSAMTSSTWSAC